MSRVFSRAFFVGQKLTKDQVGPRDLGPFIPFFFAQSLKFMFDEDERNPRLGQKRPKTVSRSTPPPQKKI